MSQVPIRLHIGGEEAKTGWTILNIQNGPNVDAVGDCSDLSQFADGSVAEIYASHVFEHVGYLDDLPKALLECRRVLSPGGKLGISVPDFETLCRLFIHPQLNAEQRFTIMRITFGGQTDAHDFHTTDAHARTFPVARQGLLPWTLPIRVRVRVRISVRDAVGWLTLDSK